MSEPEAVKSGAVGTNRRSFVKKAATAGVFQIVAPHVLGGPKYTPPSETFGAALIGAGGRGPGTFGDLGRKHKLAIREIARCDVKWVGKSDDKTRYTDFRRLLERNDLDAVAATMVSMGKDTEPILQEARKNSRGHAKVAITHALGQLSRS